MKDFFKKVNKASYMSSTDSTYVAQLGVRVEPEIVNLHPAQDTLRARWAAKAVTNAQLSAVYTVLTEIAFGGEATDPFFAEGLCPPSIEYTKVQDSKVKKHYGVEGGLTNAAIAAMAGMCNAQGIDNQIMSEEERQLTVLEIAFRNAEDWAIINGNSTTNPLAFDGLAQEVTAANGSLVLNLAGADLSKADIDNIIAIQMLRGIRPTAIVSNPMMINHILELYYTGNVTVDRQNNPYSFVQIPSVAGMIDLVGDVHVGVAYVGAPGETVNDYTSTVYILTEEHNGVALLYMDYLIPESILPNGVFSNGTRCTSTTYGIYAVGTLVSRANVAQAKITNAGFSSLGSQNTVITSLSSQVV